MEESPTSHRRQTRRCHPQERAPARISTITLSLISNFHRTDTTRKATAPLASQRQLWAGHQWATASRVHRSLMATHLREPGVHLLEVCTVHSRCQLLEIVRLAARTFTTTLSTPSAVVLSLPCQVCQPSTKAISMECHVVRATRRVCNCRMACHLVRPHKAHSFDVINHSLASRTQVLHHSTPTTDVKTCVAHSTLDHER